MASTPKPERPASDRFYGDRDGHIVDPFGHRWTVATHVEDVEPDEMIRRIPLPPPTPSAHSLRTASPDGSDPSGRMLTWANRSAPFSRDSLQPGR